MRDTWFVVTPVRNGQSDNQQRDGTDQPAEAVAPGDRKRRKREGNRSLATLVPEYDQRNSPAPLRSEPSPGCGQRNVCHHALTKQSQQKNSDDDHGNRSRVAGEQCRDGKNWHHQYDHSMSGHDIYQPANERQAKCTCQCRKHIEPAKLAMTQVERSLPFRNRRGNEIRLPETGKIGEHEAPGNPAEVASYEFEHVAFNLR